MTPFCPCREGHPSISSAQPGTSATLKVQHHCSHCGALLFEAELAPGMQICATRDIQNDEGNYSIPKGRLVRLTGFTERAGRVSLVFSGLLAAGSFGVEGFASRWDIKRLVEES